MKPSQRITGKDKSKLKTAVLTLWGSNWEGLLLYKPSQYSDMDTSLAKMTLTGKNCLTTVGSNQAQSSQEEIRQVATSQAETCQVDTSLVETSLAETGQAETSQVETSHAETSQAETSQTETSQVDTSQADYLTSCFLCGSAGAKPCPDCDSVSSCNSHLAAHRPDSTCLPFRVSFQEGKGRVVIASRDIKEGLDTWNHVFIICKS